MGRSSHSIPQGISVFAPVREGLCNLTITYACVSSHCNSGWGSFLSPFASWHPAYPWTPQQAFLPPDSPPGWWVDNLQFPSFEMHRELYHERQTRLLNNTRCAGGCLHSLDSSTTTRASATHCLPICCWWTTMEISWDPRKEATGTFSSCKVFLCRAPISSQWLPVLACSLQPRTFLGTELALHHTTHALWHTLAQVTK